MSQTSQNGAEGVEATGKTKPQVKAVKAPVQPVFKPSIALDAPAAVVAKAIVSIGARGKKLDNEIHSTALACLFHADKHGDITLMNRLLLAMPKSSRRNALGKWAVQFGKFKANEDKGLVAMAPLAFDKEASSNIEGATATPFWELKATEGGKEWDFGSYMQGVIKTLEREVQRNIAGEGEAASEMLVMLKAKFPAPSVVQ